MTQIVNFVGDVHGETKKLRKLVTPIKGSPIIQVGDFGYGFSNKGDVELDNICEEFDVEFIRGNHDDPDRCKKSSGYIADGQIRTIGNSTVMFVGGAYSIDHMHRTPNVNWWADEELSQDEWTRIIETYCVIRPDVLVTHDCPSAIQYDMFGYTHLFYNRTSNALNAMMQLHSPKFWIFGHHHMTRVEKIGETTFVCVDILKIFELDFDKLEG